MTEKYTIGLDFGTNSVRALLVSVTNGEEIADCVYNFPSGKAGIVLDPSNPDLARQEPQDYLDGTIKTIQGVLQQTASRPNFSPNDIIGIGVDATGSTPIPVDSDGTPLALKPKFTNHPAAKAWLWKDHTSHAEAAEITAKAKNLRPHYLDKCGGAYSSEWFWSKIYNCLKTAPEVFEAAYTWVEHTDWIPAILTGTDHPSKMKRCMCAAGHKGMFNPGWGGYPDTEFLSAVDPKLAEVRKTLPSVAYNVGQTAGVLTSEWAEKTGLPMGIPVAMAAIDAHLGAVGSGAEPGVLVKIMGTSGCDMLVASMDQELPDIPGLCGIVPESILPGCYGLEAGQSALGDIYNWLVNEVQPASKDHVELTKEAETLKPGQSGLLALDWHNGNRTVLIDQRLTGGVIGLTLHTQPAELYRTMVEATAFGARVIMERFEEYGQKVHRIVNCGGISAKNSLVMQIFADIMGRPLEISASTQTCALGAAMCGAVVAGKDAGGFDSFKEAADKMVTLQPIVYQPIPENQKIYNQLFGLYKQLHDAFGIKDHQANLSNIMKDLLTIRDEARKG